MDKATPWAVALADDIVAPVAGCVDGPGLTEWRNVIADRLQMERAPLAKALNDTRSDLHDMTDGGAECAGWDTRVAEMIARIDEVLP